MALQALLRHAVSASPAVAVALQSLPLGMHSRFACFTQAQLGSSAPSTCLRLGALSGQQLSGFATGAQREPR